MDEQTPNKFQIGYEQNEGFAGEPQHNWWIKGPKGGVHIWARIAKLSGYPNEWIGGVECHWANCPDNSGWFNPEEPSQADCWLLKGPCWHDGSSLYFRERIAPRFPYPDSEYRNDASRFPLALIEHVMRQWYDEKIEGKDQNDD